SHPAVAAGAVAKVGNVDLRDGDRDQVLALSPDHLAARDVLAQLLLDAAPDYVPKTEVVTVDLLYQRCTSSARHASRAEARAPRRRHAVRLMSPRAKMLATKFSTSVAQISQ